MSYYQELSASWKILEQDLSAHGNNELKGKVTWLERQAGSCTYLSFKVSFCWFRAVNQKQDLMQTRQALCHWALPQSTEMVILTEKKKLEKFYLTKQINLKKSKLHITADIYNPALRRPMPEACEVKVRLGNKYRLISRNPDPSGVELRWENAYLLRLRPTPEIKVEQKFQKWLISSVWGLQYLACLFFIVLFYKFVS